MEVTVRGPHLCLPSSAHGAPVPEVPVHLHPHAGRRPAALLHGRRGNPEPAAGGPGDPAGGVGQPAQPAGSPDGPHRGHHPGIQAELRLFVFLLFLADLEILDLRGDLETRWCGAA